MTQRFLRKKKYQEIPGIIVECKSGRFLAYYDHRTDIIANGSNEVEAKKNLKELYANSMEYEREEEKKSDELGLPKDFKVKKFTEKITF